MWQVSWLTCLDPFPAFPTKKPVASSGRATRSQLRGQLRFWSLMGIPHRIPFSSARSTDWAEPLAIPTKAAPSLQLIFGLSWCPKLMRIYAKLIVSMPSQWELPRPSSRMP